MASGSDTAAAPGSSYHRSEDATAYRTNASFVYSNKYTAAVSGLLNAQSGEAILDLGCGSGELTKGLASLVGNDGSIVGVDASAGMIDAARKENSTEGLPEAARIRYDQADGCALSGYITENGFEGRFDKVFSNAALHWMKASPAGVVEGIHRALKPGGVVAAEFGGFTNVIGIRGGLHQVLRRRGIDPESVDPWYFPTDEAYTALLSSPTLDPPFQVLSAELVPRMTPLTTGLRGWLTAFGGPLLNALPSEEREGAVQELEDLLRPDMYDPIKKQWSAMYVRLRVKAVKPSAKGLSPVIPLSSTPSAPGPIAIDPALVGKFATVSPESSRAREAADRIQSDFINQTVRVTIPDGRIFEGTFLCVDDGMNIILSQTNELRVENGGAESSRFVGMVMIKGEDVVKVGVKVGNSQAVGREGQTDGSRPQPAYLAGWPTDPAAYA